MRLYAADGYARRRGAAVVCTTYGVGELSALNGLMGPWQSVYPCFTSWDTESEDCASRRSAITPSEIAPMTASKRSPPPHSCVSARLTPDNVVVEVERVIDKAAGGIQTGYLTFPMDLALMPITGMPIQGSPMGAIHQHASVEGELEAVLDLLETRIKAASKPVVLPTITLKRFGLVKAFERFLNASGLSYATTPMDKGLLSEEHPAFLGMYNGARSTPAALRGVVKTRLVVDFGGLVLEDLNTGLWSGSLDPKTIIALHADWVQAGHQVFTSVSIVIAAWHSPSVWSNHQPTLLIDAIAIICPDPILPLQESSINPPIHQAFIHACSAFFGPTTSWYQTQAPAFETECHTTTVRRRHGKPNALVFDWMGTPAALGCALADPERRVVLVTGDGAHQLTVQEVRHEFMQIKLW